jgi:hypothetical protein
MVAFARLSKRLRWCPSSRFEQNRPFQVGLPGDYAGGRVEHDAFAAARARRAKTACSGHVLPQMNSTLACLYVKFVGGVARHSLALATMKAR